MMMMKMMMVVLAVAAVAKRRRRKVKGDGKGMIMETIMGTMSSSHSIDVAVEMVHELISGKVAIE